MLTLRNLYFNNDFQFLIRNQTLERIKLLPAKEAFSYVFTEGDFDTIKVPFFRDELIYKPDQIVGILENEFAKSRMHPAIFCLDKDRKQLLIKLTEIFFKIREEYTIAPFIKMIALFKNWDRIVRFSKIANESKIIEQKKPLPENIEDLLTDGSFVFNYEKLYLKFEISIFVPQFRSPAIYDAWGDFVLKCPQAIFEGRKWREFYREKRRMPENINELTNFIPNRKECR